MHSNLYVDNIITGCDKEQDVVNYYREVRTIMCDAKLNLHSWSSNSVALTTIATTDNTAESASSVNVLGLRWIPALDKLHLAAKPILTSDHLVTKREVLQNLSKVFDPLGFVASVIIRAKMLMQTLWQQKVMWDEPLQDNLQVQWKNIANDLKTATHLSVSRRYLAARMSSPVVHCFADASQYAYGAVVYFTQDNEVSFVAAKTRVAPLKELTIPRLKLMAALVANFVTNAIPVPNLSVFVWSDSQIVLHWIKSQKPLPMFVRNRISEITSLLPSAIWNHCQTANNPADLLSRGTTAELLMSSQLWQHGPKWHTMPNQWPSLQPLPPLSPLVLAAAVATEFVPIQQEPPDFGLHQIITIGRHSSLIKLLTVTAYVCRFIENLRAQLQQRLCGPVTAEELQRMSLKWVKDVQQSVYRKEINNLQLISRQSKTPRLLLVRQLQLFLDTKTASLQWKNPQHSCY